ncbi:hypothetical protein G647_06716 [Cladophialophora carrionii CBS 160.54]|uniref:Uncharacterized protein n=1 Tax=Cladophialophora carrionii CBS 160.54 TaxID=1279043 RepID=V9D6Y7_9EURO|nr:uncharacterized protein G647_06716 [Cladophialophora carrionii CBS 160.54]ETI22640.1 hypothetical protein G647_06716 [Cladophialophora carrionii CBS 160.54]
MTMPPPSRPTSSLSSMPVICPMFRTATTPSAVQSNCLIVNARYHMLPSRTYGPMD